MQSENLDARAASKLLWQCYPDDCEDNQGKSCPVQVLVAEIVGFGMPPPVAVALISPGFKPIRIPSNAIV